MKRYIKASNIDPLLDSEYMINKLKRQGIDIFDYIPNAEEYPSYILDDIFSYITKSGDNLSRYLLSGKYYPGQIHEIVLGLEEGIDVSQYDDPRLDFQQMRHERLELGLKGTASNNNNTPSKTAEPITFPSVLNALKSAGIDTTKSSYEMRAETYGRYGDGGDLYTIKFTCPGDYLAYLAMYIHEPLTKANILNFVEEYFGNLDKMLEEIPSLEDMRSIASSYWWGDGSDYIIYLRNLTTGETLHEADYYPDEYEDEYEEDWDE